MFFQNIFVKLWCLALTDTQTYSIDNLLQCPPSTSKLYQLLNFWNFKGGRGGGAVWYWQAPLHSILILYLQISPQRTRDKNCKKSSSLVPLVFYFSSWRGFNWYWNRSLLFWLWNPYAEWEFCIKQKWADKLMTQRAVLGRIFNPSYPTHFAFSE